MIQELLGGGSDPRLVGDTKITIETPLNFPLISSPSLPHLPSTSTTTSAATTTTVVLNPSNSCSSDTKLSTQKQLKCPRCESSNTKFCYYNNYNLTQPRHFCKTCRRYWTQGGSLRNIPIGGGCRKSKSPAASSFSSKPKPTFSPEMLGSELLQPQPSTSSSPSPSPNLWPSLLQQEHTSHIWALLRSPAQFPSFNPSPSPISSAFTALKADALDSCGSAVSSLLGNFPRSNQYQVNGFGLGSADMAPNCGNNSINNGNIGEIYQKLKCNCNENPGAVNLGNVVGSTSSSSSTLASNATNSGTLEEGSVGGTGDHLGGYGGILGSAISCSWSEFPTVPF